MSTTIRAPRPRALIDVAKTLYEPTAEESGSSGQKNTLAAYFLPQWSGVLQNQFQIQLGKRVRWAHQPSKGEMIISDRNTSHGHAAPFCPESSLRVHPANMTAFIPILRCSQNLRFAGRKHFRFMRWTMSSRPYSTRARASLCMLTLRTR